MKDQMLKWFDSSHLQNPELQEVSLFFSDLATTLVLFLDPGPERTVALRKLLEARDAAIRAATHPGE